MTERIRERLAAAVVVLALAVLVSSVAQIAAEDQPVILRCPEDAVLVGTGNFEHGLWDQYQCGPARDDYRGDR